MHELEASAAASTSLPLLPSAGGAPALLHAPNTSPDPDPDSDPKLEPDAADPTACPSLSSSLLLRASLPSLPPLPLSPAAPDSLCAREAPTAAPAPADVVEPGLDPAQELALLGELDGGVAEVAFVDAPPVPLRCAALAAAPCMANERIRQDQCTGGLQAKHHGHRGSSRCCAAPDARQPHAATRLGQQGACQADLQDVQCHLKPSAQVLHCHP